MSEEREYENPHNAEYIESFQRCIRSARGGDHEVVLRYLICRDERLAELGVASEDNLLGFLEKNKFNRTLHDEIFERFDPEFIGAI